MTFYLKYRPRNIDELDLAGVRERLTNIVKSGDVPHAFLFSGPRGAGKTSAARIMAKVVNCESKSSKKPCNKCKQCKAVEGGSHVDVVEMDAASNRGIDDIRVLRENVMLSPSMGMKRVYVIDEAHMLTTEASNALLKTLEEPPRHVMFILATTEPHRLPITVRSRLFNVEFSRANRADIERMLRRVVKGEKMKIQTQVYALIVDASDGSFREAVKILEELKFSFGKITEKKALDYLNKHKGFGVDACVLLLSKRDKKGVIEGLTKLVDGGGDINDFTDRLIERVRSGILFGQGLDAEEILGIESEELVELVELLLAARLKTAASSVVQLPLEIAILKWIGAHGEVQDINGKESDDVVEIKEEKKEAKKVEEKKQNGESVKLSQVEEELWGKLLTAVRARDPRVEGLLRSAKPIGQAQGRVDIGVHYQFHKERLESSQIRSVCESVFEEVFGGPTKVYYTLSERESTPIDPPDEPLTPAASEDIIEAAKDIFGG